MSDLFVTQVTTETPKVLIIGHNHAWCDFIARVVRAHGLEPEILSPNTATPDLIETLNSAYKAIVAWTYQDESSDLFETVLPMLMRNTTPVVGVFMGVTPPEKGLHVPKAWAQAASYQEYLIRLWQKKIGRWPIIAVSDVLLTTLHSDTKDVTPVIGLGTQLENELDEVVWHPIDTASLGSVLKKWLFNPHVPQEFHIMGIPVSLLETWSQTYQSASLAGLDSNFSQDLIQITNTAAVFSGWQTEHIPLAQKSLGIKTEIERLIKSTLTEKKQNNDQVRTQTSEKTSTIHKKSTHLNKVQLPQSNDSQETALELIYKNNKKIDKSIKKAEYNIKQNESKASITEPLEEALSKKNQLGSRQINDEVWEQKLKTMFVTKRVESKVEHVKVSAVKTTNLLQRLQRRKGLFWGGLLITSFFVLAGLLAGTYWVTYTSAKSTIQKVWVSDSLFAKSSSPLDVKEFESRSVLANSLRFWLQKQTDWYSLFLGNDFFNDPRLYVALGDDLSKVIPAFTQWRQQYLDLLSGLFSPEQTISLTEATQVFAKSQELNDLLAQSQGRLKELKEADISPETAAKVDKTITTVADYRKSLNAYQSIYPLLSSLFGYEGKRTYAIVLQNEQELRPTGGFIQAVALATFDKGIMIDLQVKSVYDLDAQQTGTVKAPDDIKAYLGESQWFLRDSNWSPDFAISASQMAAFLERESNQKIDGVLGITVNGLKNLMTAIGPLDIPEYNELLTDKNIWERMEYHSEIQFSTPQAKADYGTVVLTKILRKLTALEPAQLSPTLAALGRSATNQDLQINLTNQAENSSIVSFGWSGVLVTPQCPAQFSDVPCVIDTIAQVEANVGVNKANYHIERQVTHDIVVQANEIVHKRRIVLKNTASSNAWPKGPYKSFTRFYVPTDSSLIGITVDGVAVDTKNIVQREEYGKKVWGLLTETPIQSQTTIELQYSKSYSPSAGFSYVFLSQRQAGTTTPVGVTVTYPDQLQPALIAPQARIQNQKIIFENGGVPSVFITIKFS